MFVYDLKTETVSDHFLINVDCELESTAAETLNCVHQWVEVDNLHLAPQISRPKAYAQACNSTIAQSVDNSDVLSEQG